MSKSQNLVFWTTASVELKTLEEMQKLETVTAIVGLTETGKIWAFEWFLSIKLDFVLECALQIARQAQEPRLLSELEEKDKIFFTRTVATLGLCALGEKQ